jgi:hypothetical protein
LGPQPRLQALLLGEPVEELVQLVLVRRGRVEQGADVEGAQDRLAGRVGGLGGGAHIDGDELVDVVALARKVDVSVVLNALPPLLHSHSTGRDRKCESAAFRKRA